MTDATSMQQTIEALAREKLELRERMQKIDIAIASLSALTAGNRRNHGQRTLFSVRAEERLESALSLTKTLQEALSDRKTHTLDGLVDHAKARGIDFGSKSARRAVNFALQGLKNAKRVERAGNGWKIGV